MDETDADRRQHCDDARADIKVRPSQIRDDDSGERRVRDSVADERELAQDHVRAHRRAKQPDGERRDEGALHERVMEGRNQRVDLCVT